MLILVDNVEAALDEPLQLGASIIPVDCSGLGLENVGEVGIDELLSSKRRREGGVADCPTNPLERFNREIGRRTDVVGIFPDDPSLIRLVSMLAIEANDEWLVGRSYISQGSMAALYESQTDRPLPPRSEEEVAELAAA